MAIKGVRRTRAAHIAPRGGLVTAGAFLEVNYTNLHFSLEKAPRGLRRAVSEDVVRAQPSRSPETGQGPRELHSTRCLFLSDILNPWVYCKVPESLHSFVHEKGDLSSSY